MSDLYVKCPFCDEDDFDLYGLKMHLNKGYCDVYNDLIDPPEDKKPFVGAVEVDRKEK